MTGAAPLPGALQRARGEACIRFRNADGVTRLADLYQAGSAKIRLPRAEDGIPIAVLLNTAGGITGGDRFSFSAAVDARSEAVVTSQASERIYRSAGGVGEIVFRLAVGAGAAAAYLPQETIVFDGAGYRRRTEIDLAGDSRLIALEWTVLGRTAMGERVTRADIAEQWRIRRDGRLVLADALRLQGDPSAILAGSATGGGAAAYATLVVAGPGAEARLEEARALLPQEVEAGFSAFDGLLVGRFLAADGRRLRTALTHFLQTFRGTPLPRVWSC